MTVEQNLADTKAIAELVCDAHDVDCTKVRPHDCEAGEQAVLTCACARRISAKSSAESAAAAELLEELLLEGARRFI